VTPAYHRAVKLGMRQARTLYGRTWHVVKDVHWRPQWSRAEENPPAPEPVAAPLFAILGTYNEADLAAAAVRNAFAQGVERVYLVDNGSTDDTVAQAVGAGAVLADSFESRCFEESLRILLMNAVVWRISSAESADHIWWLWMDADEFSHGPAQQTVADYVAGLDRRYRVVGADVYRHFPDAKPEYIPGFHPLEFQPLCEPFVQPTMPRCGLRHHKHPLQRFDRAGPFLTSDRGYHACQADDRAQLVEPATGIVTHHFQFREEASTRRRLAEVYDPGTGRAQHHQTLRNVGGLGRLRSVDAVYAQRWDEVDNQRHNKADPGVQPRPWSDISGWSQPKRWYDADDLSQAIDAVRLGPPVS
jgi:glycosyltransferase involved in cell wall biosynthesis